MLFLGRAAKQLRSAQSAAAEHAAQSKFRGEISGKRVEFVGLQATITDVLTRVQLRDGAYSTTLVHPSQPRIEVATRRSRSKSSMCIS